MTISAITVDNKFSESTDKYVANMNKALALSPLIRQGKIRKYAILETNQDLLMFSGRAWNILNPLYMGIIIMALFGLMWGWTNWGVYIGFAICCISFFISDTFTQILLIKGLKKINKEVTYKRIKTDEVIQLLQEDKLVWDKK